VRGFSLRWLLTLAPIGLLAASGLTSCSPPSGSQPVFANLSAEACPDLPPQQATFAVSGDYFPSDYRFAISFYVKPWQERPDGAFDVLKSGSIWVKVFPAKEERHLRSVYEVPNSKLKESPMWSLVRAAGTRGEYSKFEYDYTSKQSRERGQPSWLGTYYFRVDKSGRNVVIDDPGNWAGVYTVWRQYNRCVELLYQFSKELPMNRWHELDDYMIAKVTGFERAALRSPPNNRIERPREP
jgi:hypothetical protein